MLHGHLAITDSQSDSQSDWQTKEEHSEVVYISLDFLNSECFGSLMNNCLISSNVSFDESRFFWTVQCLGEIDVTVFVNLCTYEFIQISKFEGNQFIQKSIKNVLRTF